MQLEIFVEKSLKFTSKRLVSELNLLKKTVFGSNIGIFLAFLTV